MGDDDLVLLALALLWRLFDSLVSGAVVAVLALAAITATAGLIAWAGRVLPTSRPPPRQPAATDDADPDRTTRP